MSDRHISRRQFLAATAAAYPAFALGASPKARAANQDKPNVVVIYTDDQDFDQLGCWGGNVLTPNIDRLARQGTKLNRYYACSPVCTPSRYNALTGRFAARCLELQKQYPTDNPAFIRWNTFLSQGETTVAHLLKRAGYATGFVGKYHLFDNEAAQQQIPPDADARDPEVKKKLRANYEMIRSIIRRHAGFDYVGAVYANNMHALSLPKSLQYHNAEWITAAALDFIKKNADRPFFLYMPTTLPHAPNPTESLNADPRITPLGYLDEAPDVQPSRKSVFERVKQAGLDPKTAGITWLDDSIGAVLDKLDELGLTENTLVIFASDHGSRRGKMTCYEAAANTLCIIRYKGSIAPGRSIDKLTANIDIVPTILDAAGIKNPDMKIDGRSLLPLLENPSNDNWRTSLYLEVTYTRAVVTDRYKYLAIRYPDHVRKQITPENRRQFNQEGTRLSTRSISGPVTVRYGAANDFPGYYDYDQLYDLKNDPREQKNLAYDPAHKKTLGIMKSILKGYSADLPHDFAEFKDA